ncbi:unnamed protein product [Trifolium pratense]|uniref:Uncharacterized protein n=1 Tax=Trifolium pratense TaxID=57577 RepID=A0ACB0LC89_TRIPR|nr:unnamed protein product [Trifolium pratense]
MKPTLLTTLSLILFALTTHFPLSFTQESVPVLDTDGNPLIPGAKYYILPTTPGLEEGGGLRLGITKGQKCPITIIQDFSETFLGLPVKFNVKDGEDTILEDYSRIDIEFNTKPECAHSSKWVLVENNTYRTAWICIGSIEDIKDSNGNVINGVFSIMKECSGFYKLVYRSSALGGFTDIKSYDDITGRRLVIVNPKGHPEEEYYRTFNVKFIKASGNGRSIV